MKQRVVPKIDATGAVRWIGTGKKTVDVKNIKERFKSLGITVDWNRFDRINRYRNEIEHYYSTKTPQSVQRLLADSFLIIRDFISDYLDKDPKLLLGDNAWAVLIEISEVYEKEKSACVAAIEGLRFFNDTIARAFERYSCNDCGSGLIMPSKRNVEAVEAEYSCKSCEETFAYEDIVKLAVPEYFCHEDYLSHTDGDDSPITNCPRCDGIYLYNEGICSSCGHVAEHECQRCASTIIPEELYSEPFCGYCVQVMSNND